MNSIFLKMTFTKVTKLDDHESNEILQYYEFYYSNDYLTRMSKGLVSDRDIL